MKKILMMGALAAVMITTACDKDFLDRTPQGVLDQSVLASKRGVNGLLIAAYSELDGWAGWNNGDVWASAGTNWVYGDVTSDDAYKGSDAGDQSEILLIERYTSTSDNRYYRAKWGAVYDGVTRSNDVLTVLALAPETEFTAAERVQIQAEARFLRAHYHMEAKKMWNKVPYIDENVSDPLKRVPNNVDIWPSIEADLQFAIDNLPETQAERGRASKFAAIAYLAKAKLFQGNYAAAKPLLDQIINSGRFRLAPSFHDNFNAATQYNAPEIIFAIQFSVNDGAGGAEGTNANYGNVLNFPYNGGPGTCCGFHQPSQNLVNAYQTDANGLPLLDTFNATDVTSDQGINSGDPFSPHTGPLDPRLDWTVGRRGIPYLDWGLHPGSSWIRDQSFSGPYAPKKHVYYRSQQGTLSHTGNWTSGQSANDYAFVRYAQVLLWAAECEVEVGTLEKAREYVNLVRSRAANPSTWVKLDNGANAANYVIGLYNTPWTDKEVARKAVRFETRLEMAMEGHRFFDLVRWGVAADVLNAYIAGERTKRTYLNGAVFQAGQDEYFPIPLAEIQNSFVDGKPTLEQNPGH
ncbi:MAG: RagB/SusD family nutrient uptake outer membrane protein [Bacteroidia bacterium]|nr:RagB/SusD family nutrient uptake outer membrane protein [Bacteroidia bacterium]